jgi:hypothetical protein
MNLVKEGSTDQSGCYQGGVGRGRVRAYGTIDGIGLELLQQSLSELLTSLWAAVTETVVTATSS